MVSDACVRPAKRASNHALGVLVVNRSRIRTDERSPRPDSGPNTQQMNGDQNPMLMGSEYSISADSEPGLRVEMSAFEVW
jgi:hypothetical protein